MTDPVPQSQTTPTPPRVPGWVRAALAISVALNLGIAGLALGAWLGDGPGHHRMPRDLSFGPFGEALNREDRRALKEAFERQSPGMPPEREAAQAEIAALIGALRAEPYDPAALSEVLQRIEDRLSGRIDLGRTLLEDHLRAMPDAERAAFADRLEMILHRGPGG